MRRLQKAMIGVFCGGVFLAGLGTGIAVYLPTIYHQGLESYPLATTHFPITFR